MLLGKCDKWIYVPVSANDNSWKIIESYREMLGQLSFVMIYTKPFNNVHLCLANNVTEVMLEFFRLACVIRYHFGCHTMKSALK